MTENISQPFFFGAATSAYQAEGTAGSRLPVSWDREFHDARSTFNADVASDFYHTFANDFACAKSIGLNAVRISIAWSRIIKDTHDTINQEGVLYYHKMIDSCLSQGLEPFVTLHHFDTPSLYFDCGDWLNKATIDHFVTFARICFSEYGKKVRYWITINEPWSVACGQYVVGHFPPHVHYDLHSAVKSMHAMMVAHAKCAALYKTMGLSGQIGIVHILESKYPLQDTPMARHAAEKEDVLANAFLLDATLKGFYDEQTLVLVNSILQASHSSDEEKQVFSPNKQDRAILENGSRCTDFIGINYYTSHFLMPWDEENDIHHNGTGQQGTSRFRLKGLGQRVRNINLETTAWDWAIYPKGLEDMLQRLRQDYDNPRVYVTENGLGDRESRSDETVQDAMRIAYLKQHIETVLAQRKAGCNIHGYFIWSLFDLLSWTNGYTKRYGLFYTDFATQKRYPKQSALWMREFLHGFYHSNI